MAETRKVPLLPSSLAPSPHGVSVRTMGAIGVSTTWERCPLPKRYAIRRASSFPLGISLIAVCATPSSLSEIMNERFRPYNVCTAWYARRVTAWFPPQMPVLAIPWNTFISPCCNKKRWNATTVTTTFTRIVATVSPDDVSFGFHLVEPCLCVSQSVFYSFWIKV